ncbi:unnamed protein product [Hymenolepis diminuta]|uniref:Myosin tail domain-containing protein n=1 Tax=Hymenolepis diminuta TaxID=6216 RepID=A0A564Y2R5_HYMDI|nr:unnamed protein product [Hymenolepis diminuta]
MMHRNEELEEVQTALEESEDRYKRTLSQLEQERDNAKRYKVQIATLEERLVAVNEQLENENAEKQNANRTVRRLEKRLKEVSFQVRLREWRLD